MKTYSEILNILHVLKQKQFRNKYIIKNIENKISNGLPMTPPIMVRKKIRDLSSVWILTTNLFP